MKFPSLQYNMQYIIPEGSCAPCKLKRIRTKNALAISPPERGCCQVDMLETLGHIVAQK